MRGVRSADTRLPASNCPADAVCLAGVCREFLWGLAREPQGPEQLGASLRSGGQPSPRPTASAIGLRRIEKMKTTCSLSAFGAAHQGAYLLSTMNQRSASLRSELVWDAPSVAAPDPPTFSLVAELVGQPNVVGSVQAAVAAGDRIAIGRWSPRSKARRRASLEVTSPSGTGTDRHPAGP